MGTGKEGEESRKRVKERIRGKMDRKKTSRSVERGKSRGEADRGGRKEGREALVSSEGPIFRAHGFTSSQKC